MNQESKKKNIFAPAIECGLGKQYIKIGRQLFGGRPEDRRTFAAAALIGPGPS